MIKAMLVYSFFFLQNCHNHMLNDCSNGIEWHAEILYCSKMQLCGWVGMLRMMIAAILIGDMNVYLAFWKNNFLFLIIKCCFDCSEWYKWQENCRSGVTKRFTPRYYDPNIINFTLTAHFDTCHLAVSHNAKSRI